jgi:hypothetical protein
MQQQHRKNRYPLPSGFAYKKFLECSISLRECAIRDTMLDAAAAAAESGNLLLALRMVLIISE